MEVMPEIKQSFRLERDNREKVEELVDRERE
jgi:hypothetical protein